MVTSAAGLCGGYNSNIIKYAEEFIAANNKYDINLIPVGKKGYSHFKKSGHAIEKPYTELSARNVISTAKDLSVFLTGLFLSGEIDQAYVAYTRFDSSSKHPLSIEQLLEIKEPEPGARHEYISEPDINIILEKLLPVYMHSRIRFIFSSALAPEYSERVIAMSEATNNAEELLKDMTMLRNKLRQANITREIIEVISAADAVKG